MQQLPFDLPQQTFDLLLILPGVECRVRTCDVEEALSELGSAKVLVSMTEDFDFEPMLDAVATLVFTLGGLPIRRFTMRLERGDFVRLDDNALIFELTFKPALAFLRYGKNIRKFRDMTPEAIISQVLDENGVAHRWQTTRKCASRPYCVQYRETHLDFVTRLLEFEGIYYAFEQDGTLLFFDDSRAADNIEGPSSFELIEGAGGLAHGDAGVTEIRRGTVVGTGKATVNDFDWKKPSLSLLKTAAGKRDTQLEVYDYPTGYRDPDVGALLARLRIEMYECEKRFVEGTSTVPFFSVGKKFEFSHEEAASFSGQYLLRKVTHHYEQQSSHSQAAKYDNQFTAIFADTPFRPPLTISDPVIQGNHTVRVRGPVGEEIHTDTHGRAKVQFHWDREAKETDEDSRWVRVLQETSSSMQLARVGWEMSVSYIDGDPDRPIAMARLINGQMMPTYAQPGFKNRMTIKTETYPGKDGSNEIRLEDSIAQMTMDWHAQKDLNIAVENDRTENVGNDYRHLVKKGVDRAIEKTQRIKIGQDDIVDLGRSSMEAVGKDRTETIGGNESVDVKDSGMLSVQGNDKENVGAVRLTISGGFGLDIPKPKDIMSKLVATGTEAYEKALKIEFGGSSPADIASSLLSGTNKGDLAGALQQALPTPEAIASDLTGGLSDVKSVGDLADKVVKGSINRLAGETHLRLIGAALVELAGQTITNVSNKLYVELVGGMKMTTSTTSTIQRSMADLYSTTVGGMILRKAKGDVSTASKKSTITVGGATIVESAERLELHGKEIELEAGSGFSLTSGSMGISMSGGVAKITGELKLKAGNTVRVAGGPDKLV